LFFSLFSVFNFLKADIYYNLFFQDIQNRNLSFCLNKDCIDLPYQNILEPSYKPNQKELVFTYFINSVDLKLTEFLKQLHKSHYTQYYKYNLSDSNTEFNNEIRINFQSRIYTISPDSLRGNIYEIQNKKFINPLFLYNLLTQEFNINNQSYIDFHTNESHVVDTINFPVLLDQINLQLNSTLDSTIVAQSVPQVPVLKNLPPSALIQNISTSSFIGSNANRIHNIKTSISKMPIIRLKPHQEFSFLDSLGEIDFNTGYVSSLVITSQGFDSQPGGGVCQYSTAAYLASLNAGLEILQRSNHSKAISYYAQDNDYGLDASIYPGVKDLVIKNPFDFDVIIFSHYKDYQILSYIISTQKLPSVELILNYKVVNHLDVQEEIIGEYNTSKEPLRVQEYIPNIKTHWIRVIDGNNSDDIFSNYLPQPRILDYSKS